MTTDTSLEVLLKQPFVEGLQTWQVERLATLAKEVWYEPETVIFREGDECSRFFLIVSGRVALEMLTPKRAFRIDTLSAGDELGWSALLAGTGRHFQARALGRVTALSFEAADLLDVCRADMALGFALMTRLLGVVSGRLEVTRLQVLDMYWPAAKRAGA